MAAERADARSHSVGHPFTAAVSGAGALSQRLDAPRPVATSLACPSTNLPPNQPAFPNALLAAFLTREDATKLEGRCDRHRGLLRLRPGQCRA
jgi:hypothetical protein